MNRTTIAITLITVILAVTAVFLLVGRVAGDNTMKRISLADSAIVYCSDNQQIALTYTGLELGELLSVLSSSKRDNHQYDTPVGLYMMTFYQGATKIDTIPTCSNLFRASGVQHRAADHSLSRLVDDRLEALKAQQP